MTKARTLAHWRLIIAGLWIMLLIFGASPLTSLVRSLFPNSQHLSALTGIVWWVCCSIGFALIWVLWRLRCPACRSKLARFTYDSQGNERLSCSECGRSEPTGYHLE